MNRPDSWPLLGFVSPRFRLLCKQDRGDLSPVPKIRAAGRQTVQWGIIQVSNLMWVFLKSSQGFSSACASGRSKWHSKQCHGFVSWRRFGWWLHTGKPPGIPALRLHFSFPLILLERWALRAFSSNSDENPRSGEALWHHLLWPSAKGMHSFHVLSSMQSRFGLKHLLSSAVCLRSSGPGTLTVWKWPFSGKRGLPLGPRVLSRLPFTWGHGRGL